MTLSKTALSAAAALGLAVLSGCGAEEKLVAEGDPPEVTCERLEGVFADVRDVDPEAMGFGEILTQVSEAFSEIEMIADETQDDELAKSIDTLAETLNSSIASAGGDIDAVQAEFTEQLEQPEVREAVTYVDETCDLDMPF